jgi:hypothetical protein
LNASVAIAPQSASEIHGGPVLGPVALALDDSTNPSLFLSLALSFEIEVKGKRTLHFLAICF